MVMCIIGPRKSLVIAYETSQVTYMLLEPDLLCSTCVTLFEGLCLENDLSWLDLSCYPSH